MAAGQDSSTTTAANAPTASPPTSNPAEAMSKQVDIGLEASAPSLTSATTPAAPSSSSSALPASSSAASPSTTAMASSCVSSSSSPSSHPSASPTTASSTPTLATASTESVISPRALRKPSPATSPVISPSSSKPLSAPQSPGRSAVTKSKAGGPFRPKRHRCRSCRAVANPIVGTCSDCTHVFCSNHRLPEDHSCEQAEAHRAALKNQHRETMLRNATRQNKVVHI